MAGVARLSDVEAWRSAEPPATAPPPSKVCWRMSDAAAARAGCAHTPQSVCIAPELTQFAVAGALECIPKSLLPKASDTADVLVERLGRSSFLDDAHVLRAGNGKRKRGQSMRIRLNASTYKAPRRKSWSVVVEGEWVDADGDSVVALYNYNAYGRTAQDVRCAPMPQPVFGLGVHLWLAAREHLCEESRLSPPTHCQLLFYYCIFNSSMGTSDRALQRPQSSHLRLTVRLALMRLAGRHHDNYTIQHTRARLAGEEEEGGSTHAGQENSQRIGSEVLLYTEGSVAMDCALSFPPSDDLGCDIHRYVTRAALTIRLGKGTLFILKACDDEFLCHEAAFPQATVHNKPQGHRLCFVFRWLTVSKVFRADSSCAYKGPHTPAAG